MHIEYKQPSPVDVCTALSFDTLTDAKFQSIREHKDNRALAGCSGRPGRHHGRSGLWGSLQPPLSSPFWDPATPQTHDEQQPPKTSEHVSFKIPSCHPLFSKPEHSHSTSRRGLIRSPGIITRQYFFCPPELQGCPDEHRPRKQSRTRHQPQCYCASTLRLLSALIP